MRVLHLRMRAALIHAIYVKLLCLTLCCLAWILHARVAFRYARPTYQILALRLFAFPRWNLISTKKTSADLPLPFGWESAELGALETIVQEEFLLSVVRIAEANMKPEGLAQLRQQCFSCLCFTVARVSLVTILSVALRLRHNSLSDP
jgi:hypothetical protein